jgi:transcriptional regulator with XRE-family HTH domain
MEERAQYLSAMSRRSNRTRPKQGAHLMQLRQAAGLTQAEVARVLGVPQQNVAFWEFAEKPPRSDVLPKLAQLLGVSVEAIISPGATSPPARRGPKGKLQKAFEAASSLPRSQQQLVEQFVSTLLAQRKVG